MENNFEIVIFPLAQADMEEIFNYISNNLKNKIAAGKLINDFKRTIEMIRLFPESFPLINNEYVNDKNIRKVSLKNYIIFYRIVNYEIQIIRVLHGLQKYEKLL